MSVLGHCRRGLCRGRSSLLPILSTRDGGGPEMAAAALSSSSSNTNTEVKPFSQLPGPKGLPFIGSLLDVFKTMGSGHLALRDNFEEYGATFKMTIAKLTLVHTRDIEVIEKMHRLEGKYPRRIHIEPWLNWRKQAGLSKGILTVDGPEWKRMRTLLDKRMLRPRHVATYVDGFNEVVTDFVDHIRDLRERKGNGVTVPNLDQELFHWALETIGTVLYERRFGSFSGNRDPSIAAFINAVHSVFRATEKVIYFPPLLAKLLIPKWSKMHEDAWRTIFTTGKALIDGKMVEMSERLEAGEEVDGFLPSLINDSRLTQSELYANIAELMLGAVDTTSNTMQWLLLHLAEHEEAQDTLYREVMAVTGGDVCNNDHLHQLPYLKAFVKEVLRLYPVTGTVTRVLNEDLVLGGFLIPKDTTVLGSIFWTGRDPQVFDEPEKFQPERWLRGERGNEAKSKHSFAWLPFGFGPRMCVGRRVAELEMYLLTSRLVQNFRLEPVDEEPVNVVTRGLVVPSRAVNVKFIDRH